MRIRKTITAIFGAILCFFIVRYVYIYNMQNKILKEIITRLEADSRIAEVLVSKVFYDKEKNTNITTIKFLEYDSSGKALQPKYFSFSGNILQFQALVIRFEDIYIRNKDALRGKSAYIFWKVFMLDGPRTQEFEITKLNEVPEGYKINSKYISRFEESIWERFWAYALNPSGFNKAGIKNAQIEAPGTMFVPGTLYTLKIEHDGGIRIDAQSLPGILKGEYIPG